MVSVTDTVSYLKIQLSDVKNSAVVIDPDSLRLSKNILNILSQINYVIPTQLDITLLPKTMKSQISETLHTRRNFK